ATSGGSRAEMTLLNHPIHGPVFSGLHEQPFVCMTDKFRGVTGGLGKAKDQYCSVATRVEYRYKAADGSLKPLADGAAPPADVPMISTSTGNRVPYIVRIETGTINRGIYQIAVLHDPSLPAPT